MSTVIDLKNWKFHLGEVKKYNRQDHNTVYSMTKAGGMLGKDKYFIDDNLWQDVTVPHDYCIAQDTDPSCAPSLGYKPSSIGWYYTAFNVPEAQEGAVLLDFEGVALECAVYVNGTLVCRNFSAYTGFICDVTDYVVPGENRIAVRVENTSWEGWWYEGAGIYRPARVHLKDQCWFVPMETHILTENTDEKWRISAQYLINGEGDPQVVASLYDGKNKLIASGAPSFSLEKASLWSPDSPYLYTVRLDLINDGKIVDTDIVRIGLRSIEWRVDGGMYLNGERCFVKGICCHQDHGGVGIAVPHSLLRWRLQKLKELGCNAYRCAHHNPSRELLELCDELGLMVMSENRHFTSSDTTLAELRYLVKNSRNHPCVFIYSLLNEEPWQKELRGKRIAQKLKHEILKYDTGRAITGAINGAEEIDGESAADVLDVMGMNYSIHKYEKLYAAQKKVILGTENGPVFATRGEVNTSKEKQVYGNYADVCAAFGQTIEDTLETALSKDYVAGVFLWSGFDYRGEPQPFEWPSVSSHWGVCDICGFEKDIYYLVKSYYSTEPVIHVLPAWQDFTANEPVHVAVFTNMDTVTLTLNKKIVGQTTVTEHRADFTIPFEAGVLEATGTAHAVTVSDRVMTAGKAAKLACEVIHDRMYRIVNVTVTDENGIPCSNAVHPITIDVKNGAVIGCSNGNPNDPMPGVCTTVRAFHGKCQFIVEGANASIHLSAPELSPIMLCE